MIRLACPVMWLITKSLLACPVMQRWFTDSAFIYRLFVFNHDDAEFRDVLQMKSQTIMNKHS